MSTTTSFVTDADIRAAIQRDFGGYRGGRRLEAAIHVSSTTASILRRGGGDLRKPAAYYGYVRDPETPGQWIKSAKPLNPRFAGKIEWTPDIVGMIEYELSHGRTTYQIADDIGITRRQLMRAFNDHGIKKPARPLAFPGINNVPPGIHAHAAGAQA